MGYTIWFACGIAAVILANKKGRATGVWALLYVLFGPATLIVALVTPDAYTCPNCMKGIDKEASICPYCRSKLTPVRAADQILREWKPPWEK